MAKSKKIYFRNVIVDDAGRMLILRGYYYKDAEFIGKSKLMSY
jgi:hypothetical protein